MTPVRVLPVLSTALNAITVEYLINFGLRILLALLVDVLPVISIFESKPKDSYRVSLPVYENFIKEDPYYINVTVIAVHRTSLSNYSKNNRPWITSFVDGIVSVKLTVRIWRRNRT